MTTFSTMASQDPTAPLGWAAPVEKSQPKKVVRYSLPQLQSIVCGQARCNAIMNGAVVSQGEQIRGYRVVSINSESVTLNRNGKHWTLSVFAKDIKN
ncbi:MSHA biogenesis protein MshK [Vibrio maerlii]|uniref:MSHA biogenesis protein MshK n=1 Tax=Vibrio maerlii TaxID=2231648 RepID=UPI000E3C222B|nr:MSHA biogenesis protein MshK [Vibrio maerlii]